MKRPIYNDVLAAVSYIATVPEKDRSKRLQALLDEAEIAHWYSAIHGAAHPVFGDGSLMAAALRHGIRGDTTFATRQGRAVWISVLTGLQHHFALPDAQVTQRVMVGSKSSRFAAIASPQSSQ